MTPMPMILSKHIKISCLPLLLPFRLSLATNQFITDYILCRQFQVTASAALSSLHSALTGQRTNPSLIAVPGDDPDNGIPPSPCPLPLRHRGWGVSLPSGSLQRLQHSKCRASSRQKENIGRQKPPECVHTPALTRPPGRQYGAGMTP